MIVGWWLFAVDLRRVKFELLSFTLAISSLILTKKPGYMSFYSHVKLFVLGRCLTSPPPPKLEANKQTNGENAKQGG